MMRLLRALKILTERRREMQHALAEHSKGTRRIVRVAEDISRENQRHELEAHLLRVSKSGRP